MASTFVTLVVSLMVIVIVAVVSNRETVRHRAAVRRLLDDERVMTRRSHQ